MNSSFAACLVLSASAWAVGCYSAPDDVPHAPPSREPLKKEVIVVLGEGTLGDERYVCPEDQDDGPNVCPLYCPEDDPGCGDQSSNCNVAAWDADGDGEVYTQECHSETQSLAECDLCCSFCGTSNSYTFCATGCPTFGGPGI